MSTVRLGQKKRTQMQIGSSNDRFYFLSSNSSDRMITKQAMKNFKSERTRQGETNTKITKSAPEGGKGYTDLKNMNYENLTNNSIHLFRFNRRKIKTL